MWFVLFLAVCLQACSADKDDVELPPADLLPKREKLPDAPVMLSGTPVKTASDWYELRRCFLFTVKYVLIYKAIKR